MNILGLIGAIAVTSTMPLVDFSDNFDNVINYNVFEDDLSNGENIINFRLTSLRQFGNWTGTSTGTQYYTSNICYVYDDSVYTSILNTGSTYSDFANSYASYCDSLVDGSYLFGEGYDTAVQSSLFNVVMRLKIERTSQTNYVLGGLMIAFVFGGFAKGQNVYIDNLSFSYPSGTYFYDINNTSDLFTDEGSDLYSSSSVSFINNELKTLPLACIGDFYYDSYAYINGVLADYDSIYPYPYTIEINGGSNGYNANSWATILDNVSLSFSVHFAQYHFNSSNEALYNTGYSDGQADGYEQGLNDGASNGYNIGYEQGYNIGYTVGVNVDNPYTFGALFGSVADTPILIVRSLFNFDFFGVNVLTVVLSLFTAFILFYLLRKLF